MESSKHPPQSQLHYALRLHTASDTRACCCTRLRQWYHTVYVTRLRQWYHTVYVTRLRQWYHTVYVSITIDGGCIVHTVFTVSVEAACGLSVLCVPEAIQGGLLSVCVCGEKVATCNRYCHAWMCILSTLCI